MLIISHQCACYELQIGNLKQKLEANKLSAPEDRQEINETLEQVAPIRWYSDYSG